MMLETWEAGQEFLTRAKKHVHAVDIAAFLVGLG